MSDTGKEEAECVDWSEFDRFSENTCYCRCDQVFRSHSKFTLGIGMLTRKPCPGCGRHNNCRRVSSDVEPYSI